MRIQVAALVIAAGAAWTGAVALAAEETDAPTGALGGSSSYTELTPEQRARLRVSPQELGVADPPPAWVRARLEGPHPSPSVEGDVIDRQAEYLRAWEELKSDLVAQGRSKAAMRDRKRELKNRVFA